MRFGFFQDIIPTFPGKNYISQIVGLKIWEIQCFSQFYAIILNIWDKYKTQILE